MRIALALCLLATILASAAPAPEPRTGTSLDTGWRFHRGELPDGLGGRPITAWRWKAEPRGDATTIPSLTTDAGWRDAGPGQDVFGGRHGFAWFLSVLPGAPAKTAVIAFDSVDDNATVYLNGTLLGRHEGWADPFSFPAGAAWKTTGDNLLAVLVENGDGPGSVGKAAVQGLADEPKLAPTSPVHPAYDDKTWTTVDAPHDYVIDGPFVSTADNSHGSLPFVVGWYRRALPIPASARGRRLWLEFDGVFSNSRYWLNGREIGHHRGGYTSFRFDITDAATPGGRNLLAVKVDPKSEGWWYEGGGIYRHVRLVTLDPVHLAPWGVFVNAAVADPKDGLHADAAVTIKSTLANQGSSTGPIALLSEILDAGGKVVAQTSSSVARAGDVTQTINLPQATLWSLDQPYLYSLRSSVSVGGRVVDRVTTPFGARQLRYDADHGFFLNGKPVKMKGVCCHQDHAGVGVAIPDRLQLWRLEQLKTMGCNAYRTSHNAPSPELLAGCDRLGILVMDETRHLGDTWSGKTAPGTKATELLDLTDQVMRDRNHPSVVMWSMCNEEGLQSTREGGRIFAAMKARTDALDGTRPVTAAMNGGQGAPGGFTDYVDLQGFNYSPGAYAGFHRAHPKLPVFGSETASEVGTRGIYATERWDRFVGDRARGFVSAYGVNAPGWAQTAESAWRPVAENEYVFGCFVWTGFDYKGEPTPFGWPDINSNFGILDECGFPKDSYWYYQSWWTDKPVMHLLPHWTWPGREGQEIEVWCYSNCPSVELFLNGTSLGAKEMKPNQHLVWKVPYAPGTLTAKGSYKGTAVSDTVETTGAPAKLVLLPDRTALTADGSDLAVVNVKVADAQGRTVPTASNLVHFTVTGAGRVLGVGNGDPTCHEPDKAAQPQAVAAQRSAFNGLCQVLVQTTRQRGAIAVKAEADGLTPATVALSGS